MPAHTFSFYSPDLTPADTTVSITDDEHKHLARVLRLGTGDLVRVTNGHGLVVTAEIEAVGAKHTTARVSRIEANHPAPVPLTLALAMLPRERMEIALTQCTEAGITGWIPLLAERCHVRKITEQNGRDSLAMAEAALEIGETEVAIDACETAIDIFVKRHEAYFILSKIMRGIMTLIYILLYLL